MAAAPTPLGVLDVLWWHDATTNGTWADDVRATLQSIDLQFLSPVPDQVASPALRESLRTTRCLVFLGSVRNADPDTTIVYGPYRVGETEYASVAESDRPGMALAVQLANALTKWRTSVLRAGIATERPLVPLAESRTGLVGTGAFFRIANSLVPPPRTRSQHHGGGAYTFAAVRDFLAAAPEFRTREDPTLMHVLAGGVDPTHWSWSEIARAFWDVTAQATHRWIFSMTRSKIAILRIEPVGAPPDTAVHVFDPPFYARVHPDVDMLMLMVGIRGARRYALAPSMAGARPWIQQSGSTLDALRYTQEWALQGALRAPLRVHTKIAIRRPVTQTLKAFKEAAVEVAEHVQLPVFSGMDIPGILRKYMPRLEEAESTVAARDTELANTARQSAEMTKRAGALQRKLDATRVTLDTLRSERDAYERELRKVEIERAAQRADAEQNVQQLAQELQTQRTQYESVKEELERNKAAQQRATDANASAMAVAEARTLALQQQLQDREAEIAVLRARVTQCEQELAATQRARTTLETDLEVARAELVASRAAAQEMAEQIQSLSTARTDALARAASLEAELTRAQDDNAENTERIARLESEYRTALADVEFFDQYTTELLQQQTQGDAATETRVAELRTRLRQQIQKTKELEARLRDAEEARDEIEARLREASQDAAALREDVDSARTELELAETLRKEAAALARGLQSILDKEQRKLAPLAERLQAANARVIENTSRIEDLEAQLEQCKTRETVLQERASRLDADVVAHQQRIVQLTRERDSLVAEKQQTGQTLAQLTRDYSALAEKERALTRELADLEVAHQEAREAMDQLQFEIAEMEDELGREIEQKAVLIKQHEADIATIDRQLREIVGAMTTFLTDFATTRDLKNRVADDYKRLYREYLVELEIVAKKHLTAISPMANSPSALVDPDSLASQLERMHIRLAPGVFAAMRAGYQELAHVPAHEFYVQTRQTRPMDVRDVTSSGQEFARIVQYKQTDAQGASLDAVVSTDAVRGLLYREIFEDSTRTGIRLHLWPGTPAPVFRVDAATGTAAPIANAEAVRRHPHYKQWKRAAVEMARVIGGNNSGGAAAPVFAVWRSTHTQRLEPSDVVYVTDNSNSNTARIVAPIVPRQGYLYLPRSPLFGEARAFAYKLPSTTRASEQRRVSIDVPDANLSVTMHAETMLNVRTSRVDWILTALYISPALAATRERPNE